MPHRDAVFPANPHALYDAHGYSAAIRSENLLFVSGQVGSRPDGSPEPDFREQVRLAFGNLKATLLAAGCTFDDIVDVTTFHTDPQNQFETIAAVKNEIFKQRPYPNWTAVGVNWLSGFDFEIKVIARIPSRTSASVSRRNPPTIWDMASGGYSQISVAEPGRLALLSGQVGWLPSGGGHQKTSLAKQRSQPPTSPQRSRNLGRPGKTLCCCASTSSMQPRNCSSRSRLSWMN
jgi:enamine deaminase RidA (YjgF/YER057c/UK114 family)